MKIPDERVIVRKKGEAQVKDTENIFNKTITKSHNNKMFLT